MSTSDWTFFGRLGPGTDKDTNKIIIIDQSCVWIGKYRAPDPNDFKHLSKSSNSIISYYGMMSSKSPARLPLKKVL